MKRKWMVTWCICLMAILAAAGSLPAQEGSGTGRLKGVVANTDKTPIIGAALTLEYVEFKRKLTKTSGKSGRFAFLGLGKGTVRLTVTKEGYKDEKIMFTVSGVKKNPDKWIFMKRIEAVDPEAGNRRASKGLFTEGLDLFEARKFDAALEKFKKFRDKQPKLHKVAFNIANCYLEMQRYDEAVKELETVLEKIKSENADLSGNDDAAKIYSTIGDAFMRQNKLTEAAAYFKKAIEIKPTDHAVAYNVAEIFFVAGKTDDAIPYYRMAIKIKPKWAKAYKQLGYAYLNKGDIKQAVAMFGKFLELDPESPEAPGIKEVLKSL